MNVWTLDDLRRKAEQDDRVTTSFTGGEKSGLAVQNPVERPSSADGGDFAAARGSGPPPPGSQKVTLYQNGYIINDGEFNSLDEPKNAKFLEELKAGYAPKELQAANPNAGQPLHIVMDDRRHEIYQVPSTPKTQLFSGGGNVLNATNQTEAPAVDASAGGDLVVNRAAPTTEIQIRFHNGQRARQTFNESHTVGDLHNYIMSCAPLDDGYKLLTGYPPQPLTTDNSKTLKEAGLLNEVVTQSRGG